MAVSRSVQKPRKKNKQKCWFAATLTWTPSSLDKECWICSWLLQAQSTLENMQCCAVKKQHKHSYFTPQKWPEMFSPHLSHLYNYKKSILLILLSLSFPDSHRKPASAAATLLRSLYIAPIRYLRVPQIMQTLDMVGAYYFIYHTIRTFLVSQPAPAVKWVNLEKCEKFRDSVVADSWKYFFNTLTPRVAAPAVPKRLVLACLNISTMDSETCCGMYKYSTSLRQGSHCWSHKVVCYLTHCIRITAPFWKHTAPNLHLI